MLIICSIFLAKICLFLNPLELGSHFLICVKDLSKAKDSLQGLGIQVNLKLFHIHRVLWVFLFFFVRCGTVLYHYGFTDE